MPRGPIETEVPIQVSSPFSYQHVLYQNLLHVTSDRHSPARGGLMVNLTWLCACLA